MTAPTSGTSTVSGVTATWEILDALPGDSVLVRYTHARFADVVWYSRDHGTALDRGATMRVEKERPRALRTPGP